MNEQAADRRVGALDEVAVEDGKGWPCIGIPAALSVGTLAERSGREGVLDRPQAVITAHAAVIVTIHVDGVDLMNSFPPCNLAMLKRN
jgi:hypothetical protein